MNAPLYTRDLLRLAADTHGRVAFADLSDAQILRSPTCGSRLATRVSLDEAGRVARIEQAVEACAFGQAAAALVAAHAPGHSLADARAAEAAVAAWLAGESDAEPWPGLSALDAARARAARHGAILLPFRSFARAIEVAR
ncbi:iron-sulfur cluster assembly scaffold protein [Sphingomonas sp. ASV193]|uniref:iron-sulfur cluster assembly scaffold protein n=1 Tax=Sphingomonas sp. ASV193 TaxID=3144405 RepID=UPI0032E8C7DA